jgi:hypothetical protein
MNKRRKLYLLVAGIGLAILLVVFWGRPGNPLINAQNDQLRNAEQLIDERRHLQIRYEGDQFVYNDRPVDFALLDKELKSGIPESGDLRQVLIYVTPETPDEKLEEISRLMHEVNANYVVKEY